LENSGEVEQKDQLYRNLRQLIATYWVLPVVGAFLFVILSGEPSFLKVIFLVSFFYFMITYQVHKNVALCSYKPWSS